MPVIQDELWKNPGNPGMIVVTCHAQVDADGQFFMDFGEAREALRRIPQIDQQCAEKIQRAAEGDFYGFLPVRLPKPSERIIGFGLFQTRYQWEQPAEVELIRQSMERLREYASQHQNMRIRMNFPGIRGEGLEPEEVASVLVPLPPNVAVCHNGDIKVSRPASFPGFKAVYMDVERLLQDGQVDFAVDYLIRHGFDIQSAYDQVRAVERILRDRRNLQNKRGQQNSASVPQDRYSSNLR